MEILPKERKKEIKNKLDEIGIKKLCPMCGHNVFSLADGYFNQTLENDLAHRTLGGPSIPCVVIICNKCGFTSQHALGVLGLLPEKEGKNG